ncbi:MAG: MFS transporter [Spirochaetota bacterium]
MRLAYFLMFSHLAVYVQYLQLHLRSLGHGNGEVGLLMGLLQVSGVAGAPAPLTGTPRGLTGPP